MLDEICVTRKKKKVPWDPITANIRPYHINWKTPCPLLHLLHVQVIEVSLGLSIFDVHPNIRISS
jgi:hypothetical protein